MGWYNKVCRFGVRRCNAAFASLYLKQKPKRRYIAALQKRETKGAGRRRTQKRCSEGACKKGGWTWCGFDGGVAPGLRRLQRSSLALAGRQVPKSAALLPAALLLRQERRHERRPRH